MKASLDNVRMEFNIFGIQVRGSSTASVSHSVATGNSAAGFSAATSPAILNIEDSVSSNNGTGLVCNAGTTVRIGNMSISGNTSTVAGTGTVSSYQNNDIDVAITVTPINPQ